jgi:hypothetical protein
LAPLTIGSFSTALAPMFQGMPQKNSLFTLEDVAELLFIS